MLTYSIGLILYAYRHKRHTWERALHYTCFAQVLLPVPGIKHSLFQRRFGFPAQNLIRLGWVGPHLDDIAFAPRSNSVGNFDAGGLLESIDELEYRNAMAGTEIEDLNSLVHTLVHNTFDSRDMCAGEVCDVDEIADARPVRGGVVISEDAQLLAYTDRCLRQIGNEILGYSVGQFADKSGRMGAYGVKIAYRRPQCRV